MNRSEAGKLGNIKSKYTQEKQLQERMDTYYNNPNYCTCCNAVLPYNKRHNKFCNQSCAAKYNNARKNKKYKIKQIENINNTNKSIRVYNYCLYCGKEITTNPKNKFCCIQCSAAYRKKSKYDTEIALYKSGKYKKVSKSTIYMYIKEKYDYKCANCGWHEINPITNKSPLEIHHIDGNHLNNHEDNLILLCPNCHSLTPNYKAIGTKNNGNRKSTRTYRKKYYK